jgi:hypothetical protein
MSMQWTDGVRTVTARKVVNRWSRMVSTVFGEANASDGVCWNKADGVCWNHADDGVCWNHADDGVCWNHADDGVCWNHADDGVCWNEHKVLEMAA